jgi:hypothetical protein
MNTHLKVAGRTIADPVEVINTYARRYGRTLKEYDLAQAGDPNRLTYEDIKSTRVIASRISNAEAKKMVKLAEDNRNLWLELPTNARLQDADPAARDGLYEAMTALYRSLQFRGVRSAKVSKVLYRKRPNLYPLLDTRLKSVYAQAAREAAARHPDRGFRRMYWAAIREDLLANEPALAALRRQLGAADGMDQSVRQLGDLRLLDIVAWKL